MIVLKKTKITNIVRFFEWSIFFISIFHKQMKTSIFREKNVVLWWWIIGWKAAMSRARIQKILSEKSNFYKFFLFL